MQKCTLYRSIWHTLRMTDTLRVISAECEEAFEEHTNLLQTMAQWWTVWHIDVWRQVKRWKQSSGKAKIRGGKMETCELERQSLKTEKVENDACWRSGRSISPNCLRPSLVYSFTLSLPFSFSHTHTLIHYTLTKGQRLDYWLHWDRHISKERTGLLWNDLFCNSHS